MYLGKTWHQDAQWEAFYLSSLMRPDALAGKVQGRFLGDYSVDSLWPLNSPRSQSDSESVGCAGQSPISPIHEGFKDLRLTSRCQIPTPTFTGPVESLP